MKITNLEVKNWNDKEYKSFKVQNGEQIVNASTWPNETNADFYASIIENAEVEGVLYQNDKGYWSLKKKLEAPQFIKNKTANMEKMIEKKQEGILHSMEMKDTGIKYSATFRDATLLTQTQFPDGTDEQTLRKTWLRYRKWLWDNWENIENTQQEKSESELMVENIPF
jgi:hypothetical protein